MSSWDWLSKFVLIGDASTGKSSLLIRLTEKRFLADPDPTVGVEFGSYVVTIETQEGAKERIKCQCWDTAGSEAFRSITRSYYRGAAGALLVYNVTHRPSFLHIGDWLRDIRAHAEENVSIILVGNMSDLCADEDEGEDEADAGAAQDVDGQAQPASVVKMEGGAPTGESETTPKPTSPRKLNNRRRAQRRQVTREEAAQYAEQEGIMFLETSAKSGANVEEAFERAARDIHTRFRATSGSTTRSGLTAGTTRPGVIAASIDRDDEGTQRRACCSVQ